MFESSKGYRSGPQIEMTPEGRFRQPAKAPIAIRLGGLALIVAVIAGALGVAALALWFALAIIPVALIAAGIAYVAFRFHLWRTGSSNNPLVRRPPPV